MKNLFIFLFTLLTLTVSAQNTVLVGDDTPRPALEFWLSDIGNQVYGIGIDSMGNLVIIPNGNLITGNKTAIFSDEAPKMGLGNLEDDELVGNLTVKQNRSITDGEEGVFIDVVNSAGNVDGVLAGIRFSSYNSTSNNPYLSSAIFHESDGSPFGRGDLVFATGGASSGTAVNISNAKMRLKRTGELTIGPESDSTLAQLYVRTENYDDSGNENVALFDNGGNGYTNIKLRANGDASIKFVDEGSGSVGETDFQIRLNSSGDLQIRHADNTNDEFSSATSVARFETSSDTYQFTVLGSALASGGTWTNSDRRIKENIQPLQASLDKVMALQPTSYDYRTEDPAVTYLNLPNERQIGLIAQDVEAVIPEVVKTHYPTKETGDDATEHDLLEEVDGLKAINYPALVPVLIGAIQEQQAQIDALKQEIAILKQQ